MDAQKGFTHHHTTSGPGLRLACRRPPPPRHDGRHRQHVGDVAFARDARIYYGTDSADDHKYTDLYSSLFDPIRASVRSITEIGLAQGQSLQVWHDYFRSARIWGIDIVPDVIKGVRDLRPRQPAGAGLPGQLKDEEKVARLGFAPLSMDIIIDDGDNFPPAMEKTLLTMWPYLRVGGYYRGGRR